MRQMERSGASADAAMGGRRMPRMDDWNMEIGAEQGPMAGGGMDRQPMERMEMARLPRRLGEPGFEEMPRRMEGMEGMRRDGADMVRDLRDLQNAPVLDMRNNLPPSVIESPNSMLQAQLGSLKAMLSKNEGNYVVATFLVGTNNTVSWEGILYDVGNDYITIYQEGRDRYVVTDIYSLKFIEFYDFERRRLCNAILRESGWEGDSF